MRRMARRPPCQALATVLLVVPARSCRPGPWRRGRRDCRGMVPMSFVISDLTAELAIWVLAPGALADDEVDAVLPLDPRGVTHLLEGVLDLGDVRDVDGLARSRTCRRRSGGCRRGLLNSPMVRTRTSEWRSTRFPAGRLRFSVPRAIRIWSRVRPPALQGGLVDVDQDLALVHGEDPGRSDAVDALEARRDLVLDDGLELHGRHVAGDAVEDDRERAEAELHDQRLAGLFREVLFVEADLVADVLGGEVEVGAPLELDADDRDALGRLRRDLLDPVDRADDLFERPGQDVLDVLGRGARIGRDDGDRRELEVGEVVEPQPGEGDGAQDDQDRPPSWTP